LPAIGSDRLERERERERERESWEGTWEAWVIVHHLGLSYPGQLGGARFP